MKIDRAISEVIGSNFIRRSIEFLAIEETNFASQVSFLGLNPKSDFKFSDLSGVDFSDSNIRGYDFTGADLRGSTGVNVVWDGTTVLEGAVTSESLFAYRQERDRFLSQHPDVAERVARLGAEYWALAIVEVANVLEKMDSNAVRIAEAVFDTHPDLTVRSNILLFMSRLTPDREAHKNFLHNIFARYGDQVQVIRPALRTLSALYKNDPRSLGIQLKFLNHPDEQVSSDALTALLSSKHFGRVRDKVRERAVFSKSGILRRQFVGRCAKIKGARHVEAALDVSGKNFLDFQESISAKKLFGKATFAIMEERKKNYLDSTSRLSVTDANVKARAIEFRAALEELKAEFKIPFSFDD